MNSERKTLEKQVLIGATVIGVHRLVERGYGIPKACERISDEMLVPEQKAKFWYETWRAANV